MRSHYSYALEGRRPESTLSVVNNAGIRTEASNLLPIDQVDEDMFDAQMRINSRGVFLCCKYADR